MQVTFAGGAIVAGGIGAARPRSANPWISCCRSSVGLAVSGGGSSVGGLVGGLDAAISDSKFSCLVCGSRSLGKNWNVVSMSSRVCSGDGHDGPGSSQLIAVKRPYSSQAVGRDAAMGSVQCEVWKYCQDRLW